GVRGVFRDGQAAHGIALQDVVALRAVQDREKRALDLTALEEFRIESEVHTTLVGRVPATARDEPERGVVDDQGTNSGSDEIVALNCGIDLIRVRDDVGDHAGRLRSVRIADHVGRVDGATRLRGRAIRDLGDVDKYRAGIVQAEQRGRRYTGQRTAQITVV